MRTSQAPTRSRTHPVDYPGRSVEYRAHGASKTVCRTGIHTNTHSCTHAHTNADTRTHKHTYTHTQTHTHRKTTHTLQM